MRAEEEVLEVTAAGQPVPSLSSSEGRAAQLRLQASEGWRLLERWQRRGWEAEEIRRSHHRDEEEEDWKRQSRVDELLRTRGVAQRDEQSGRLVLLSSDDDDDDGATPCSSSSDGELHPSSDSDSDPGLAFRQRGAGAVSSGLLGKWAKPRAKLKPVQPPPSSSPSLRLSAAAGRPLHTYRVRLRLFIAWAACRSSPLSTALALTPLNSLMPLLFPASAQLRLMVGEAEGAVPAPLRAAVKLDELVSLAVRGEDGRESA